MLRRDEAPRQRGSKSTYSGNFNSTNSKEDFKQEIRNAGLEPPDTIEPGRLHRFPGAGKKRGSDSGWCRLFPDERGGVYGDWASGLSGHWMAGRSGDDWTAEELAEFRRQVEQARKDREAEQAQRRAEAASKAGELVKTASPATADHPYLIRKGVEPVPELLELPADQVKAVLGYAPASKGEPLAGRILIAPVAIGGKLSTCELIDERGRKSAIAGGQKAGGCWMPEPAPEGAKIIAIGEGIATVLSVRQATGWAVAAALSSGNLEAVARQMRERHPNARLAILADVKRETGEIDPGAVAACEAVAGILAVPDFGPNRAPGLTDWNDLHVVQGIDAARRQLEALAGKLPDAVSALIAAPFTEEELAQASLTPPCIVLDYLYADVAVLAAAGGTGKTTCLIYEAICIALGWQVWGLEVVTPGTTLFFTAEDQRSIFAARLREIMRDMGLTDAARKQVRERVRVLDLTGTDSRLVYSDRGVIAVGGMAQNIVEAYRDHPPVQIIFDPLVSFGASEEAVNSNAQALITAARRIVRGLGCCVRYIHHTGQQAARDKTLDAYAARGGSALSDGARMVAAMASWNEDDTGNHRPPFGFHAVDGESVTILARPKLSYSKPDLPLIWIKRKGWVFEHSTEAKIPKAQRQRATTDQVEAFLASEVAAGRYHSKNTLEETPSLSLTRQDRREAINELLVSGRIVHVDLPPEHRKRGSKTFLCPSNLAVKFADDPRAEPGVESNSSPSESSPPPIGKENGGELSPSSSPIFPEPRRDQSANFGEVGELSDSDTHPQPGDLSPQDDIELF